ncbi:MAG: sensor histidine kinase [Pseudonocardiales bacterium]|nr:sensor histidine kinase [Pseudonocardiales bacterium]
MGDLVHLITELLDNAIRVTPPEDMVTLGGDFVEDKNLLVEIVDAGPGLPSDELEAINARLVSAPVSDSPVPGQMGLVVVRELSVRHGIKVQLRQRLRNRGITATVLLPYSLLTVESESEQPLSVGWKGTEEQLPLQISVVNQASATDLFSPSFLDSSSLGVLNSPPSHPRTAQEEWFELFGHHEPASEPFSELLSGSRVNGDPAEIPVASDPLWSPILPGLGAQDGPSGEVREEIFEMVSAWFRERESVLVSNSSSTMATEWRSPFDEGWRTAQALRTRVDHEFTAAGLPKRQPREHLVSGAGDRVPPTPVSADPTRTPEAVRGRLTRYQRGLRVGRHARIGPDDDLNWTESP